MRNDYKGKVLRNGRKEMWKLFTEFEKLVRKNKTTIHRVAVETDIPPTVLYDWKNGRCTPKVDKLKILADYFKVPLERLI